jgi:hypothetical protein
MTCARRALEGEMAEYCAHTGKQIHASSGDCLRALRRLNKGGGPLGNPYRCPHCTGWHQTKGQQKTEKTLAYKRRRNNLEA